MITAALSDIHVDVKNLKEARQQSSIPDVSASFAQTGHNVLTILKAANLFEIFEVRPGLPASGRRSVP